MELSEETKLLSDQFQSITMLLFCWLSTCIMSYVVQVGGMFKYYLSQLKFDTKPTINW